MATTVAGSDAGTQPPEIKEQELETRILSIIAKLDNLRAQTNQRRRVLYQYSRQRPAPAVEPVIGGRQRRHLPQLLQWAQVPVP